MILTSTDYIQESVNKKHRDIVFSINYHLERYEESIKELIETEKEFSKYGMEKYEVKWLKASLDFIKGQKTLLKLAMKKNAK